MLRLLYVRVTRSSDAGFLGILYGCATAMLFGVGLVMMFVAIYLIFAM